MRKVLIPTKLDKFAAELLAQNNYEVILDPSTPLLEQAAAHPDAEVMIVRSEAVTPEVIDGGEPVIQRDPAHPREKLSGKR